MKKGTEIGFVLKETLGAVIIILSAVWLFFDSVLGVVPLLPYALYLVYRTAVRAGRRRRAAVTREFKDVLASIGSALEAGDSAERAVIGAAGNMLVLYGEESYMVNELRRMQDGLALGKNIEDMILRFAEETKVKEIENFADVFAVAKRSGGNLLRLVRYASRDLYEKTELAREIEGVIQSTVTECAVMKIMPLAILFYLKLCAGGFLSVLYDSPVGRGIMCLTAAAYFGLSEYATYIADMAVGEET